MRNKDLLLGIDISTTGTKCLTHDLHGIWVAFAHREYPMIYPRPEWTKQGPSRWWDTAHCNLQTTFKNQNIDRNRIAAVGISSTNAVILVDRQGQSVCNAISLHDQRSDHQMEWLKESIGEEYIRGVVINRIASDSLCLPALRWLVENQTDLVKGAHKLMVPRGYVIQKLTGELTTNRPRTSLTPTGSIRTGQ